MLVDVNNEEAGYEIAEANLVESKLKECFAFDANNLNINRTDLKKQLNVHATRLQLNMSFKVTVPWSISVKLKIALL